jgi:hypothetical protein
MTIRVVCACGTGDTGQHRKSEKCGYDDLHDRFFLLNPIASPSAPISYVVEPTASNRCRHAFVTNSEVERRTWPPPCSWRRATASARNGLATRAAVLATALRTDLERIYEHTRIGEAALRWDARGRVEAPLLRGEELAAAKAWLATAIRARANDAASQVHQGG